MPWLRPVVPVGVDGKTTPCDDDCCGGDGSIPPKFDSIAVLIVGCPLALARLAPELTPIGDADDPETMTGDAWSEDGWTDNGGEASS